MESFIFLALMGALSSALCWLMQCFPRAFSHLMTGALGFFFLLLEGNMFSFTLGMPLPWHLLSIIHDSLSICYGLVWALWLYVACSLVVVLLLALFLIRPLQRRLAPRMGRRRLLVALFTLIPLQMAFYLDSFSPVFGGTLGMGFSLCVAAAVGILLLWQWGIGALGSHLESCRRKSRRKD